MKNEKKQIPLRISAELYADLERWAQDEFRSINGQIEYLLTDAVRKKKRGKSGIYADELKSLGEDKGDL